MNTGPGRNASSLPRSVIVPVRSDGSMSGVNCTRRNSSADGAGERVREQRLGDAGHAFEQQVAADARGRDHARRRRGPGRRRPCGSRAGRGPAVRSPGCPSCCTRDRASERKHFGIGARWLPQCRDFSLVEPEVARGAFEFVGVDGRAESAALRDPFPGPRACSPSSAARGLVRARAVIRRARRRTRRGAVEAFGSVGRAARGGGRGTTRTRAAATASPANATFHSVGIAARPLLFAVAVDAFGERDRTVGGAGQRRARTRRCRLRRAAGSRSGRSRRAARPRPRPCAVETRSAWPRSRARTVTSAPAASYARTGRRTGPRTVAELGCERRVDGACRAITSRSTPAMARDRIGVEPDEHRAPARVDEAGDRVDLVVRRAPARRREPTTKSVAVGIEVGVGERAPLALNRIAVAREQLRVAAEPGWASSRTTEPGSPLGSLPPTASSRPAARRLSATTSATSAISAIATRRGDRILHRGALSSSDVRPVGAGFVGVGRRRRPPAVRDVLERSGQALESFRCRVRVALRRS